MMIVYIILYYGSIIIRCRCGCNNYINVLKGLYKQLSKQNELNHFEAFILQNYDNQILQQPKLVIKKKQVEQSSGRRLISSPQRQQYQDLQPTPVFTDKDQKLLQYLRMRFKGDDKDEQICKKKSTGRFIKIKFPEPKKITQCNSQQRLNTAIQQRFTTISNNTQLSTRVQTAGLTICSHTLPGEQPLLTIEDRKAFCLKKKSERAKQYIEEQSKRQAFYAASNQLTKSTEFKGLKFEEKYEFPTWVSERKLFQDLKHSKYFNLELKLISICEIDSYKRSEDQKILVALYLQRLSLFKLMPLELLLELAVRLTTVHYPMGSTSKNKSSTYILFSYQVCKQGDSGDCMYIIYTGEVDVIICGKKIKQFIQNEQVGRNALESDEPRTATLVANKDSDLLLLTKWNYQQCLEKIFKDERPKWREFLSQITFLKNFPLKQIDKLCEVLRGKFLSKKDCLYKSGNPVDNVYIVKNGTLTKMVIIDNEMANRWPTDIKKWQQRSLNTRLEIPLKYEPHSILGYYEIVTDAVNCTNVRTDTIEAFEESFVLYVPRGKFLEIFCADDDMERFKDFYLKNNPISFEHLFKQVTKEELKKKKEYRVVVDAVMENLGTCSVNQFDIKRNKFQKVLDSVKTKFIRFKDQKTIKAIEERKKVIQTMYE